MLAAVVLLTAILLGVHGLPEANGISSLLQSWWKAKMSILLGVREVLAHGAQSSSWNTPAEVLQSVVTIYRSASAEPSAVLRRYLRVTQRLLLLVMSFGPGFLIILLLIVLLIGAFFDLPSRKRSIAEGMQASNRTAEKSGEEARKEIDGELSSEAADIIADLDSLESDLCDSG